ncbi:MAG TPA: SagB/ThcOx family dehydrogenase [Candidatus Omnitrophica bacterium]|nr:SagB/ThcOx family dehydrogenase [Candidatus Omnitrophota bacterium]
MYTVINLPQPSCTSPYSLEECIKKRSSVREYSRTPLTLYEVSRLLWAAQGIASEKTLRRTAPSAGATYPLSLYIATGKIERLESGVYRYQTQNHSLIKTFEGDIRQDLSEAALGQEWILSAPMNIVITGNYQRTTMRYGKRGIRYVWIEVGHVGENIYLQCESMGLGTVAVGAFHDAMVKEALHLPTHEEPLYIMPVGRKK